MFSPELSTERLDLVNMGPDHLDFVFEHFGNPDVHRYLVDEEPVRTMDAAREIVAFYEDPEDRLRNRWVLTLKNGSVPIGTLGFHVYDPANRSIEVGYDLNPSHWGKGLMSEALSTGLDHVFSDLGVYRVDAWVHVENERSCTIAERHGFVREGTVRAKYFFDGTWHDHHHYGLIEPDRG
jgi:[ribosomal protein S5]-alanine N-acetyltransferase